MRTLITLIFISTAIIINGQQANKENLKGCWEVIQIDNKVFNGGVITYFDFTEDQQLYAMSNNNKDHGVLKNKTLIGNYKIDKGLLFIKSTNTDNKPISYRIYFKENEQNQQQLVMEEIEENTQRILQTSYLIKWKRQ